MVCNFASMRATISFCSASGGRGLTKFNICASNDQLATFEVVEREVSKKQLEKELGYKLNIKE